MDPVNVGLPAKFEVFSFTRPGDNGGGVLKKIGQSLDTPTLPFPSFFGVCSEGPRECIGQICTP